MKYLLMLFGLSSVLASETDNFITNLETIKEDLKASDNYGGWAPLCLEGFIEDYKSDGYDFAWKTFNESNDDYGSCSTNTYNQNLSKSISEAWKKFNKAS